ncbi:hypothetical protein [Coxiella burnetii]|nr:hypothetical protein [Coxiella burnetii]ACJ19066.1 hypothetical protein CbuG_1797 [Coxiella burnetii CbuG_Q212]
MRKPCRGVVSITMRGEQAKSTDNFLYYLLHHPKYRGRRVSIYFSSPYEKLAKKIIHADKDRLPPTQWIACNFDNTNLQDQLDAFYSSDVCVLLYDKLQSEESFERYTQRVRPFLDKTTDDILKNIFLVDIADYFDIFRISPKRIQSLHQYLIETSNQSRVMRVQSELGSRITIDLTTCDPWTNLDGINYGEGMPSEIATHTEDINGTFVFTGLLLSPIPFGAKYGIIHEPVTFEIERGMIVGCKTAHSELLKDLEYYFQHAKTHRKIEEIGIGTNEGLPTLKGTTGVFEERHMGLHFGLGGKEDNSIHLDLVSADSQIYFDDKVIFNEKLLFSGDFK